MPEHRIPAAVSDPPPAVAQPPSVSEERWLARRQSFVASRSRRTGPEPRNTPYGRRCATLGIPPTTRVAAKRWGLPAEARRLARRHVDAYLWAGRPWLQTQTAPFSMSRALDVARTTPY